MAQVIFRFCGDVDIGSKTRSIAIRDTGKVRSQSLQGVTQEADDESIRLRRKEVTIAQPSRT